MAYTNVRSHRRRYRGHTAHVRPHTRHLYTNPRQRRQNIRAFEARYGARGKEVFGAVVGKVRREQVAAGRRSPIERIRGHTAHRGRTTYRVRGHLARVRP